MDEKDKKIVTIALILVLTGVVLAIVIPFLIGFHVGVSDKLSEMKGAIECVADSFGEIASAMRQASLGTPITTKTLCMQNGDMLRKDYLSERTTLKFTFSCSDNVNESSVCDSSSKSKRLEIAEDGIRAVKNAAIFRIRASCEANSCNLEVIDAK